MPARAEGWGRTYPSSPHLVERERERDQPVAILAQAVSGSSPEPRESKGGEKTRARSERGETVHSP